jgi:hypothetical protein
MRATGRSALAAAALAVEHVLEGRFAHSTEWLPGLAAQLITLDRVASGDSRLGMSAYAIAPFAVLEDIALASFLRRDVNS